MYRVLRGDINKGTESENTKQGWQVCQQTVLVEAQHRTEERGREALAKEVSWPKANVRGEQEKSCGEMYLYQTKPQTPQTPGERQKR